MHFNRQIKARNEDLCDSRLSIYTIYILYLAVNKASIKKRVTIPLVYTLSTLYLEIGQAFKTNVTVG